MDSPSSSEFARLSRGLSHRWYMLLVAGGLLLAALFVAPIWTDAVSYLWLAWTAYLALFVIYRLQQAADHLPDREVVGLTLPLLGTFLSFGLLPALGVLILGTLLAGTLTLTLPSTARTRARRPARRLIAAGLLREVGALGLGLLSGAALYHLIGGRAPLDHLTAQPLLALPVLFGVNFLVGNVLYLLLRRLASEEALSPAYIGAHLIDLVLPEIALALLATILAISFYVFFGTNWLGFALILWLLITMAPLLRNIGIAQSALSRRMAELATLNAVGEILASTRTTNDLFRAIYEQVSRLIDAPTFYIAVYNPQQQMLDFPLMIQRGQPLAWPSHLWGNGPNEHILRTRTPLLSCYGCMELVQQLGLALTDLTQPCRAFLGVPIYNRDEVFGVLAVQHPTNPTAYGEDDRQLLEIIAAQAAVALRNTRLLTQAQQLTDGVVSINQVSNIINASLNLDTILNQICETALQLVSAPKAAIFLKTEEPPGFKPGFSVNLGQTTLAALDPAQAEPELHWEKLLITAKARAIQDIAADPMSAWLLPLLAGESVRSAILAPFISVRSIVNQRTLSPHRDLIGFMVIFFHTLHASHENELRLLEMLTNQAAVAIENTNLFEETQNAVKRLAYLAEATRIFTGSLALDKVSQAVVDWIVDALDLDSATLALWTKNDDVLNVLAHARGYNSPIDLPAPDLSDPLSDMPEVSQALQSRWSCVFQAQEEALSAPLRHNFERTGLHTIVLTPLLVRDEVIGLLTLGLLQDRTLPASDINLAEAIASQAATAIQNAQFYNLTETALSDRVVEISALENMLRRIAASVDERAIIEAVLDAAHTGTRAGMLSCALLTPANILTILWRRSSGNDPLRTDHYTDIQRGVIGRVLQTGLPSLIPDTAQEPDYWRPGDGPIAYRSELCVPIQYEDRPLGALNMESESVDAFNEHHLRFVQNLAGHAAITLTRARLFASNQRQIEFLDAIRRLSLDLLGAPNMSAVLDQVCAVALHMVSASNIHLYFYDEDTDRLTFAASLWRDGRRDVETAIPRPNGMTRQGLKAGVPLISQTERLLPSGLRETLGVFPLKQSGHTIGTLNAAVDDPARLGADEVRALELLANQAAIAIERARLFEGHQRQIDILDTLRRLSLNLLDTLSLETVLQAVCSSALETVQAVDVHLYFYNEKTDRLTFAASLWTDGRRDVEAATPRPNGVTYRAARSGQTTVIYPGELHPASPEDFAVEAIASIPLKHTGHVLGVLNVAVTRASVLDDHQLRALELLANQAAVAIRTVRLHEQMRGGRDRLQTILNTIRDGMVLVDPEGYLLQVNPAVEKFLGVNLQPYVGQHIMRVMQAVEKQTPRLKDVFNHDDLKSVGRDLHRDPHRILYRQMKTEMDGQPLYLEEDSVPVLAEDGQLVGRVFVWRDVTQAHMLEETRAELTNTIVHDLRSPLTAIKGGLSVLQELTTDPADVEMSKEIIKIAENSTDNLLVLVESLLDVARMESENVPLDLTTVHIHTPVDQAISLLEVLAHEANIALTARLPDDLPAIPMDVEKMRRVLINLLDNALRYTPAGGSVDVTAEVRPAHHDILISVEDTGPGIPPEVRERIFNPWETGITGQQKRGRKGLGLGLAFCRLAVEAHGGKIWVEDGSKGGAAFRLTLPISSERSMMQETS